MTQRPQPSQRAPKPGYGMLRAKHSPMPLDAPVVGVVCRTGPSTCATHVAANGNNVCGKPRAVQKMLRVREDG